MNYAHITYDLQGSVQEQNTLIIDSNQVTITSYCYVWYNGEIVYDIGTDLSDTNTGFGFCLENFNNACSFYINNVENVSTYDISSLHGSESISYSAAQIPGLTKASLAGTITTYALPSGDTLGWHAFVFPNSGGSENLLGNKLGLADIIPTAPGEVCMNVESEAVDQLMAHDPNLLQNAADELVQEENSWYDVLADFGAWCTRVVVGGACGAISGAIVNGAIGLYFGGPAGMWAGAAAGAVSGAISGAIGGAFSSNLKEAAIGGLIDGAISGGLNGIFTVAAKALAGIDLSLKIGGPAFAMAGGGTIPSTVVTVTIPAISSTTISIATGGGVGLIDAYMGQDEELYRLGTSKESATRLGRKAAEAEEKIGIHGVSASTKNLSKASSSAWRSKIEKLFPVHNTPTKIDPSHKTIELPKPVTKQIADLFNQLFGR